jgi:hypothetical protein
MGATGRERDRDNVWWHVRRRVAGRAKSAAPKPRLANAPTAGPNSSGNGDRDPMLNIEYS